jgi:DNA-binding CsgD family transcriptional regulator
VIGSRWDRSLPEADMFDPDSFIDRIYEAAIVPETWPELLDAISAPAQAVGGVLFTANLHYQGWTASPDFAPLFQDFLATGWGERNQRRQRGLERMLRGFFTDLDLFTQAEIDADPSYDYLRSKGCGLCAALAAPVPSGDVIAFGWERSLTIGPYEPETLDAFNRLAPHLQRAALIAGRLGLEKARVAAETMRAIGLPAAVLSHSSRLLVANDLFAPLIPAVVQDRAARVAFADPRADAQFEQIFERLRRGQLIADQAQSLPIAAQEDRPPMVAHVVPIRRRAEDVFSAASCMLAVTPLSSWASPPAALIQGLFDLTPSEARVAQAIAAGDQPADIARRQGVCVDTVRSHMKGVFAKTGTSRQAELALLLSGAVL